MPTSDGKWSAWERKRGALLELARLVLDRPGALHCAAGDAAGLSGTVYLLTLDADTRLTPGAARALVGAMLHPLNRAVVDAQRGVVTRGYGLLHPRMATELESANATDWARVFAGPGGADPYGGACGELYMDCFDRGGCPGKGSLDARALRDCCLGRATGSSPVGMYKELARRCTEEGLDFSRVHSVNLDEYIGLAPEHDQSYRYFMNSNLFDHINIDMANTYVAGGVGDVDAGIAEFNAVIERSDVDVQVLGVGPDGHLGFNEPGSVLHADAHREKLDESTIDANARFFASRDDVPRYAVTMGMGGIMKARKLLLIISGSKDDAAKKLLLSDEITTECPVTFMKLHRDAVVIIEQALADRIGYKG